MMASKRTIYIGGAKHDERGRAVGGKAGDQTGGEVCESLYYRHSQGWRVFRCLYADAQARIAEAMIAACANNHIGYDQYQRNTLYSAAANVGFNPARVDVDVETDCSALVRVCVAYAGINLPDFNTVTEKDALLSSGAFGEVPCDKDTLRVGDILVTPAKGHTEIVTRITANVEPMEGAERKMKVLRRGSKGHEVVVLQALLNMFQGSVLNPDGDFGPLTESAVIAFQMAQNLEVDGIVGQNTWSKLLKGE